MACLIYAVANLASPVLGTLKAVLVALEVRKGLHDLFFGVDDKGAVLHDLLVKRSSCDDDWKPVSIFVTYVGGRGSKTYRLERPLWRWHQLTGG